MVFRGKKRRLISWKCCGPNNSCREHIPVERYQLTVADDAALKHLFVDTHVHLNEVFFNIQISQDVPSLKKSWKAMTEQERQSWTALGWNQTKWRTWKSDNANEDEQNHWQMLITRYGTKYYYNGVTGETTWDRPATFEDEPDESADVCERRNEDTGTLQADPAHDPFSMEWASLAEAERNAASNLGYTETTWDWSVPPEIPAPDVIRRTMPSFACITSGCDPVSLEHTLFIHQSLPLPRKLDAFASLEKFPGMVWVALGRHPKTAAEISLYEIDESWSRLEEFEKRLRNVATEISERLVAWGEIGLDYSHPTFGSNKHNQWFQQEAFKRQICIGLELGLPLVIHARDAWCDTMRILKEYVPRDHPIHLHCFWERRSAMDEFLEAFPKAVIGFSNNLFFPGDAPEDNCRHIPLSHIVLETDAPYLPPVGAHMSTPNDIAAIGQKVSEIREIPFTSVMEAVRNNVLRVYGI